MTITTRGKGSGRVATSRVLFCPKTHAQEDIKERRLIACLHLGDKQVSEAW
ncbi:hypothetical protein E2C01_100124 [Portunus trituberculatus]|uniref:Uncharacterized protein n=1 Tax=Portunus trituberculatus TaxID=210409 RepID=A0A5B7KCQ9_PORTR|nr:hypothetical protein [Portunus trituberculatus]